LTWLETREKSGPTEPYLKTCLVSDLQD